MSETTLLQLPLLEASQAQKHVTHNEALLKLDALAHLSVTTRALAAPPASPAEGDRFLVAAGASGAWAGQSGTVAVYRAAAWAFHTPKIGWRLWIEDEQGLFAYNGSSWIGQGAGSIDSLAKLGINTTADTTNRLAISSPAVLLNHAGSGVQIKVNKQAATDTASLLMQTGFSGRAEMGLAGDDDFHVKVSADGSAWTEAMTIDRSSGAVSFPASGANLLSATDKHKIDGAATRAALAAKPTQAGFIFLYESGREGVFKWDAGNHAASVAADPAQGLHVPPASDTSGASGAWVRQYQDALNARWFGVAGNGTTDDTAAITTFVSMGGELYFPKGSYLIAAAGPNSGGCKPVLTKSTRVRCHPQARFFTDDLDANMMAIAVPTDGAGLPAEKITFAWHGGVFDMSAMKVSTVVPLLPNYPAPPGKQGTASGTNGLTVNGNFNDGVVKSAVSLASFKDIVFTSGSHWETGGGDAQLGGTGCDNYLVENCRFTAARDLGIYFTRDGSGAVGDECTVRNCRFENCMGAASAKRGFSHTRFINNRVTNCVVGLGGGQLSTISGTQLGLVVSGNAIERTLVGVRFDHSEAGLIEGNTITDIGCKRADGSSNVSEYAACAFALYGCVNTTIRGNHADGVNAGYSDVPAIRFLPYTYTGAGGPTTFVTVSTTVESNRIVGLRSLAIEEEGVAHGNVYRGTQYLSSTLSEVENIQPGSVDEGLGIRHQSQAVEFGEVPITLPSISYPFLTDPALHAGAIASLGDHGGRLIHSDGAQWRYLQGGATASISVLDKRIADLGGDLNEDLVFIDWESGDMVIRDSVTPANNYSGAYSGKLAITGSLPPASGGVSFSSANNAKLLASLAPSFSACTVVCEFNVGTLPASGQSAILLSINDNSTSNRHIVYLTSAGLLTTWTRTGGVTQFNMTNTLPYATGTVRRAGLAVDVHGAGLGFAGQLTAFSTSLNLPAGMVDIDFGHDRNTGYLNGKLLRTLILPRRMSNARFRRKVNHAEPASYGLGSSIAVDPLLVNDGTAGAPTIARRSDTATGLFAAAGKIAIAVAGLEKFQVTAAGVAAENLSGTNTGDQNVFSRLSVSGQSDLVADSTSDTLTMIAGSNVTITTNASTDELTITAAGNVAGPVSATGNAVARFDGATGKIVRNSTVLLADDGSIQLPEVGSAAAAPANSLNLFASDLCGREMLASRGAYGLPVVAQPLLARNRVGLWLPPGNGTTVPGSFSFVAPTAVGTATARNVATTNLLTRMKRLGYVSAATAGSLCGHYAAAAQYTIGDGGTVGGFLYVIRFGVSDVATVAGARMFVGLRNATAAPTNVEPSSLTNVTGIGQLSSSSNLHIVYGGSAAQAAIDLGANFPASTLSADAYEVAFYAPSGAQVVNYRVERLNTGHVASGSLSGTVGTAIPAATTLLAPTAWRCNNATALAVGIDIAAVYIETEI